MLPHFQNSAIAEWGDEWQDRCASLLSLDMKRQLSLGAGWDCYRIATIFIKHPKIFWPSYESMVDIAREVYRYSSRDQNHGAQ
jgi:hypothetical protein